jgi:hypothetical protein
MRRHRGASAATPSRLLPLADAPLLPAWSLTKRARVPQDITENGPNLLGLRFDKRRGLLLVDTEELTAVYTLRTTCSIS